jgi:hypothetical protein
MMQKMFDKVMNDKNPKMTQNKSNVNPKKIQNKN